MELTVDDFFEAAERGDIETLERYVAQANVLAAALAVEKSISDHAIQDFQFRDHIETSTIPEDAWMYYSFMRKTVFRTAIDSQQHEVLRWLLTSHFAESVAPKTIQFFFLDAARTAIDEYDALMLEIRTIPDSAREKFFPFFVKAATRRPNESILAVLTAHGADVATPFKFGKTPIGEAIEYYQSARFIRALVDSGVVVVGDQELLHRAVENQTLRALKALLELGADPQGRNNLFQTPLHAAASEGLHGFVDALLESTCADIDAQTRDGDTALTLAVKQNPNFEHDNEDFPSHLRTIDVLLRYGADTELTRSPMFGGYTPLRWAVSEQSLPVVRKLLEAGANPRTKYGLSNETPADLLRKQMTKTGEEILQLLAQYGVDVGTIGAIVDESSSAKAPSAKELRARRNPRRVTRR